MSFLSELEKQKRKDYPVVNRNINLKNLSGGLNSSKAHFIYELLQNAEDANSKKSEFHLTENRIVFNNDGDQFTPSNIKAILRYFYSDKKDKIGHFGIGFKSVYAMTTIPEIHSGEYHFKIKKYIIPIELPSGYAAQKGSKFVLQFNQKDTSAEESYKLLKKELDDFNPLVLLFLENMKEIKWETPDCSGGVQKTSQPYETYNHVSRVILEHFDRDEEPERFLVFSKEIERSADSKKKDYIKIAYRMNKGFDSVKKVEKTNLFAFFPTTVKTGLSFILQGPFELTQNRQEILENNELNEKIWDIMLSLFSDSLNILKKEGLINLEFLSKLPINQILLDRNPIYKSYGDVLAKNLKDKPLIPTKRGFGLSTDVLIPMNKHLPNLFVNEDLKKMFGKSQWVNKDIVRHKFNGLRWYLKNIVNVEEASTRDFAERVSKDILGKKDDRWFPRFYTFLLNREILWKEGKDDPILREKPIIRTSSKNQLIEPFNEKGVPNVYMPGESKSYFKTVKRSILKSKDAVKFLKELGLRTPDVLAEIEKHVLPKYKSNPEQLSDTDYATHMKKIISFFEDASDEKRNELASQLEDLKLFRAENNFGRLEFLRPSELYLAKPNIKKYFEDYDMAFFIKRSSLNGIEMKRIESLLAFMGAKKLPKIFSIKRDHNEFGIGKILELIDGNRYSHIKSLQDKHMEGLENCLANINADSSKIIWGFLIEYIRDINSWWEIEKLLFEGIFTYFFFSDQHEYFPSMATEMLTNVPWLYTNEGHIKRPSEMYPTELADFYSTQFTNSDNLIELLGFKPEARKSLSKDEQRRLELTDNIPIDELEKFVKKREENEISPKGDQDDEPDEGVWEPEISAEDVELEFEEFPAQSAETTVIIDMTSDFSDFGGSATYENSKEEDTIPSKVLKEMGYYAEKVVFNNLLRKYKKMSGQVDEMENFFQQHHENKTIKVVWENMFKDKRLPYDIRREEDGNNVEYIEVKSKSSKAPEWVDVSENQWRFAKQLYDVGEGDKYCFYVVIDPDKKSSIGGKHTNPIKKWKDGDLIAKALQFKL